MENQNAETVTISLEDALDMVIKQLYAINVPVELIEQIGMPISMSIGNLKAIREVMINKHKTEEEAHVPTLQVVPDEEEEPEMEIEEIKAGGEA